MSMLIRDPAFGPVAAASGFVSVAFFGGFTLGPPLYGALSNYSGGILGWSMLIGVLLCACVMSLALASARRHKTGTSAMTVRTTQCTKAVDI
jgi:MFS family permease